MPEPLTIEPLGLHWLNTADPEHDLCAHGGVRVAGGGAVLFDTGPTTLAVSAAALHLLRSLERDHTPTAPLADALVPCCAHLMYVPPGGGEPVALDCGHGVNWWVRHAGPGAVELTFPDAGAVTVPAPEWRAAVAAFSGAVRAFYAASAPKAPASDEDGAWYPVFAAEWARRHAAAAAPA